MEPALIPDSVQRRIAVDSRTDPRTVRKFLKGGALRPMTRERIVEAMQELKLSHLVPGAVPQRRR